MGMNGGNGRKVGIDDEKVEIDDEKVGVEDGNEWWE